MNKRQSCAAISVVTMIKLHLHLSILFENDIEKSIEITHNDDDRKRITLNKIFNYEVTE